MTIKTPSEPPLYIPGSVPAADSYVNYTMHSRFGQELYGGYTCNNFNPPCPIRRYIFYRGVTHLLIPKGIYHLLLSYSSLALLKYNQSFIQLNRLMNTYILGVYMYNRIPAAEDLRNF